MPVLTTYPLDLSGVQVSNRITGEIKTITQSADRVFIPTGGPFYTKSLKVFQGTRLLQPVTDYIALELNRDGSLASGKEVCNVLFIKNTATSFRLDYQVIGGVYSDFSNELIGLINATPLDKLNVLTWGSIIGKPTTFPPTAHSHYPYEWRGYTQLVHLIEQLRLTVVAGDQAQFAAFYQYIDNNFPTIVSDYTDRNGLFFIDRTPTVNGNVLLKGKGTVSEPIGIDLAELLDELDARYFQNSINPLTRIGAISDSFLPVSAGFFNCLTPLANIVSLSAVANVERNGDLLTLLPATNGVIIRYVYGYVSQWSGDPNIQRYKPTNQQYRPPGLALNEEIMDLFGYHEQSMIGAIYTVGANGAATFKEHCVLWLNGTLAAENHTMERLGSELTAAMPEKSPAIIYAQSPKIVKLRKGEKFLIYYYNNSGIHVYRMNETTKKFTQTTNWKAVLQKNTIAPVADQKVETITSTTETTMGTGQTICRPFAWIEAEKASSDEYTIFDENVNYSNNPSVTHYYNNPGTNRRRMSCRVVGDVIKVMANITYQCWIDDPNYRGGSRECFGFTLEIYPLAAVPTYKWIRHSRQDSIYSTGRSSSQLTHLDRGYTDVYETYNWTLIPADLFSYWEWWESLQERSHIQLNDGRIIVWAHPAKSGYPIYMQAPTYKQPTAEYDVEKMFVLYFNTRYWRHPTFGNGASSYIGETVVNFPPPTVNRVNSTGVVLEDGTLILYPARSEACTLGWTGYKFTAYRPSASVINYATATDGTLQGFDTSANRIELDGTYDLIPWTSARRVNGTTKVGALFWYRPTNGVWVDQSAPANIRIDWAGKGLIKEELYTFTLAGFNAVEDFLATKFAVAGANLHGFTWSLIASPIDPNTGLLFAYTARDNRTATENILPVKMTWDEDKRLTGISISNTEVVSNSWGLIHSAFFDPRYALARAPWAIEYNVDSTQAYWTGKMLNATALYGDTMPRVIVHGLMETKTGSASSWELKSSWGDFNTTSGYKSIVATPRGIGLMTDEIGYGVFRGLREFKGVAYDSGTPFSADAPFIYVTPRPPSDFSLNITDYIDVQLGGVYGQIEPRTYDLTDPTVSDIVDARNKTIYIYVVLELGKPKINFREVPIAESIYATYIGKCITDGYGVMELDIQPVTRIGNYRPSATPRGASFSVSSGTADTERLLNWDADIPNSESDGGSTDLPDGGTDTSTPPATVNSAPGIYTYTLAPGATYDFEMLGGGGGGGAVTWSTIPAPNGVGHVGGDSMLSVDGIPLVIAHGGGGGGLGIVSDNLQISHGVPGVGGTGVINSGDFGKVQVRRRSFGSGLNGNNSPENYSGGGVYTVIGTGNFGYGGKGGRGSPITNVGGGGGGAGYACARIYNATNYIVTATVVVAAGGAAGISDPMFQPGDPGGNGAVLFTRVS